MKNTLIKKLILTTLILTFTLCAFCFFSFINGQKVLAEGGHSGLFTGGNGVRSISAPVSAPEGYWKKDVSGVEFTVEDRNVEFSYKHVIDAKTISKDDTLIEIGFMGMGEEDYAKATMAKLVLTDADNPNNKVALVFSPAIGTGEGNGVHVFYRVEYNGVQRGLSEVNSERIWINSYGTCAYYRSLYPGQFGGGFGYPPVAYFDYAEKSFYVETHIGILMVLDLDNEKHMGEDIWSGFTNDRCILSMEVTYDRAVTSKIYVTKLLGVDISGEIDTANNRPSVIVCPPDDCTIYDLPKAEVGTEYLLPTADIFDFVHGSANLTIKAYRGETDISNELQDGYLLATQSGMVRVEYTATNNDNVSSVQDIYVNVVNELPPFVYSKSHNKMPVLGEYFVIPEINVAGNSGILTIDKKIHYNEKEISPSTKKVLIDESGYIAITITVKGYTGEAETTVFFFAISLDKANIIVNAVPITAVKGETLILPDFYVCQEDGTQNGKKVTINGTDVTNELSYNVIENAGDILTVTYGGGTESNYSEISFEITVIEEKYQLSNYVFTKNPDAKIIDSNVDEALILSSNSDAEFIFAYPVSLDNLAIDFNFNGSYVDSLDIVLKGYENRSESMLIRLAYESAGKTSLKINNSTKEYILDVDFLTLSQYKFIIDNYSGSIYFANTKICNYDAFFNGGVNISFILNNPIMESNIHLLKISNQSFNPKAFLVGDNTAPYIYLENDLPAFKTISVVGAKYQVPAAKAYDVLSGNSTVQLSITAPSGNIIYTGNIDTAYSFALTEYGNYVISYKTKDSNDCVEDYNYIVKLVDRITPSLFIEEIPLEEYNLGDNLNISKVKVADNYDENPSIAVFLLNTETFERIYFDETVSSYKLTKVGTYQLSYVAWDSEYNIVRLEYIFKVVKE